MSQITDFISNIKDSYQEFLEGSLTTRRFRHSDIKLLIENLKDNQLFSVKQLGVSAQNREIYLVSFGTGKTKVFLWSQMHGDESTATMAMFDIFNFFGSANGFEDLRSEILKKLTLYFIPMVNPDGAEVFGRRNLFQVDLNRDAVRLQSPESRILKETFDSLKADFGFNLHDQSIYYSAGKTFKSAAISFLAPAADHNKTVNPVRKNAIKLIAYLDNILNDFIPGHIGRYRDDYEPRAFGDCFQAMGTSTILIETGGWKNDPEKQFLRKLNFIALVSAFKGIADKSYLKGSAKTYNMIPLNEEDNIMDLVLRNLSYKVGDHEVIIDLGINRTETNKGSSGSFFSMGRVVDLGDLSIYSGYDDYDMDGMEIFVGKTYDKKINSYEDLAGLDFHELYSLGCTHIIADFPVDKEYSESPVNILVKGGQSDSAITVDGPANFYISRNGKVKYIIINGFFIELENPHLEGVNGEVICSLFEK